MRSAPDAPAEVGWPWIGLSLVVALLFNMAPWGHSPVLPDLLALVLAFWAIQNPNRVLLSIGFVLGMVMDVHLAVPMGQHVLLYTLILMLSMRFQRRILWFHTTGQMIHMLGIFLVAQSGLAGARLLMGSPWLGPEQYLTWLSTALLWPLADLLLSGRRGRAGTPAPSHNTRIRQEPVAPTIDPLDSPAPVAPEYAPRPAWPRLDRD